MPVRDALGDEESWVAPGDGTGELCVQRNDPRGQESTGQKGCGHRCSLLREGACGQSQEQMTDIAGKPCFPHLASIYILLESQLVLL